MSDKVWHTLEKDGEYIHHVSDLQFDSDGVPHAILEWLQVQFSPENEIPSIRFRLDPKYLHRGNYGRANYLYQLPLTWPE
jgi:hypothetical protein